MEISAPIYHVSLLIVPITQSTKLNSPAVHAMYYNAVVLKERRAHLFFFKLRNQIKSEDMKEILWKYRRAVYFISYFISFDLSGDVEQNHIEFAN